MTITSKADAPLVVVVGATGAQGGSVVAHLAESDKAYRIRGLTRDASKPKAEALKKEGVEMVSVTIAVGKEAEVKKAFVDADIVFAVTNFWEHISKDREVAEGKLMVDAAKAVGAKLFIWSGVESFIKGSGGKYTKVSHFDGKAEVTDYVRQSGLKFVDVQPGFYASNNVTLMKPQPAGDGTYVMASTYPPEMKLPVLDVVHDYGLFVRQAIESPRFKDGGVIQAYSEWISSEEQAKQITEVTGIKVVYKQIPESVLRGGMEKGGSPPAIIDEFVEQNAHFAEFGYYNGKPGSDRSDLARKPRTWIEFVKAQGDWHKILGA